MDSVKICNKTKIVLIRPYGYDDRDASPPFGIISISNYLKTQGIESAIVDFYDPALDEDVIIDIIVRNQVPFVGISAISVQFRRAITFVTKLKKRWPGVHVILGGQHFSGSPQSGADIGQVVVGSGEISVAQIIRGQINSDKSVVSGEYLDSIEFNPLPDPSMLEQLRYSSSSPYLEITTSRGCPFQCKFCLNSSQSHRYITYYNMDHVIEYIDNANRILGFNTFHIVDDIFFVKKKRVFEFCDRIDALGRGLKFRAFTHASFGDSDMYKRAKQSGFTDLSIGIESGNNDILKLIGKNITVEKIEKTVKSIFSSGLTVSGLFMIGNMGETISTIKDSIRFASHLRRKYKAKIHFSIAQPFPGSQFKNELDKYGTLLHENYEDYTNRQVSFVPYGLNAKQIFHLREKAHMLSNFPFLKGYLKYCLFRLFPNS